MSQQEWATPSGPPPPTQDTTSLVAAALLSRQSRNTMTSILIRSDLLTSEQPLISRRHERREEGVGLRTRTGWVGVVGWGGRAAPQHAGLCRGWTRGGLATAPQGRRRGGHREAWPPPPGLASGWTRGGLATTPRVPRGLAGNSVPLCLAWRASPHPQVWMRFHVALR